MQETERGGGKWLCVSTATGLAVYFTDPEGEAPVVSALMGRLFFLQIYWYRQGDLEPKFRNLIYYTLFSITMLCICANLYFHEVGK